MGSSVKKRIRNREKTRCVHGHEYSEGNTSRDYKNRRVCLTCQRERMRRKREQPKRRTLETQKMRDWRTAHSERDKLNWRNNRLRKRQWINEYKASHPCKRCGESELCCLDFHHRDPSEKEIVIAVAIARYSLERIQMEVAKCDVLCSNCHRKFHFQQRQQKAG